MSKIYPYVVLFLSSFFLITPSHSQEDTVLDEIFVYGEKRAKSLLDTQASVGVLGAEDILDKDIQTLREAFRLFGNVIDADWVDAGFVIRGVNSEGLTPGGAPLASIYLDGSQQTVQGARRGGRGLWDVEQVEIYRGPQSTLSGRASLAGAIYVRTKNPTKDWDFAARATAGSNDTLDGAIAFGGPLSDRWSFRLAGEYQSSENDLNYPRYERYDRFEDFIEDEYHQVRGKLQGTYDNFDVLLTVASAHDSPTYNDIAGPGLGSEFSERRGDLNADLPFFQETREADNDTASLEITVPLSSSLTLTSLTSLNKTDVDVPSINEGTAGEIFTTSGFEEQELFTQELRLNSDPDNGSLSWVLGLYFAQEEQNSFRRRSVFFGGGREDRSEQTRESDNLALFGELDWSISDLLTLTVGGRIDRTENSNDFSFVRDNFNPMRPDFASSGRNDQDQTTFLPKFAISRDFASDQTVGFTIQRGFRVGGAGVDTIDGSPFSFNEELTWNYELSYRNKLFNDKMTLSANVFYTDWEDQQVDVQLVPGDFTSSVTLNAGSSELYGAELESQIQFSDQFSGFFSVGVLETEFKSFVTTVGDFSGFEFPEAPDLTVAAGINYEHASGFYAGFDAQHVSSYLARDLQNAPVDTVGDYVVANARLGYRTGPWNFTLFSDNAFDEDYFVYRDVIGDFDCCASVGTGRLSGLTVTYQLSAN